MMLMDVQIVSQNQVKHSPRTTSIKFLKSVCQFLHFRSRNYYFWQNCLVCKSTNYSIPIDKMNYPLVACIFIGMYLFAFLNVMIYFFFRSRTLALKGKAKTMVVLGSGGHTAEMLNLISKMNLQKYDPRIYVVADTDSHSEQKAIKLEMDNKLNVDKTTPKIVRIPRSREVGQSYFTSVLTTINSFFYAFHCVFVNKPQVLFVNGPGTCIPIVVSVILLRSFGFMVCKIIYIESIARVEKLSLSGKIMYYLGWADGFEVMWEKLKTKFPRSNFGGRLY
eukprot:TRINITY_DN4015_c0_g1_i1.p1 TRINITY_DN4015_c0_g1~~TRINITY_DN4015_c0_g1_i1.p1  ORF type:complete len:278 (-),score=1.52 TRINITY_DN4015_c0_g1_i1:122-955(-)